MLGVRLFQRSTRGLTLTEAGERFLRSVRGGLDSIQSAIADITANAGQPAGVLKLSASPGFGMDYLLPLMPAFLERYPAVLPDWTFDNRQVDLIADGFDAAIGGGIELTPGMVARELARIHIVAVAAPSYLQGRARPRMVVNDPEAVCRGVLLGMGVGLIAMPHALLHLDSGAMVRLLPDWHADAGPISLYFASQKLLPAKTRAFVDFVIEAFRRGKLARRFAAVIK